MHPHTHALTMFESLLASIFNHFSWPSTPRTASSGLNTYSAIHTTALTLYTVALTALNLLICKASTCTTYFNVT